MITLMRIVAVSAALGLVAAVPHTAAASSASASWSVPVSRAPAWAFDSDDSYPCPFVAEPGYLEGSGGNSQVIQDNDHAYMGCGGGPTISLEHIDGDTVTFALHGDRVRVRKGATERLGPYRVHVVDVRGQRVELELSDPGT
jgi:hypothetical protein